MKKTYQIIITFITVFLFATCLFAWPSARNGTGAPATIYLGDKDLAFHCDAYQDPGEAGWSSKSWAQVFITNQSSSDIENGTSGTGRDPEDNQDDTWALSPQFTSVGSWFWSMRISYGFGNDVWHCRNDASWYGMWSDPDATLSVTVNALNNPVSQSATRSSSTPTTQIDLSWSKDSQGHNAMIVRKTSSQSWTEPTQGTSYSVGTSIGSGKVVYNSNGTSYNNTGLDSDTVYDYKFYSENYNYYSAGVVAQATTLANNPGSFTVSQATLQNEIDLDWTKNSDGDNVMIAQNTTDTLGIPVNGTSYAVDDSIPGGGTVVYNGSGADFTDSGLLPNTLYYYKAWSVGDVAYSAGITGNATTTPEPGMFIGLILAGLAMMRSRR